MNWLGRGEKRACQISVWLAAAPNLDQPPPVLTLASLDLVSTKRENNNNNYNNNKRHVSSLSIIRG